MHTLNATTPELDKKVGPKSRLNCRPLTPFETCNVDLFLQPAGNILYCGCRKSVYEPSVSFGHTQIKQCGLDELSSPLSAQFHSDSYPYIVGDITYINLYIYISRLYETRSLWWIILYITYIHILYRTNYTCYFKNNMFCPRPNTKSPLIWGSFGWENKRRLQCRNHRDAQEAGFLLVIGRVKIECSNPQPSSFSS